MLPQLYQIAPNFVRVDIGDITVWYSYSTPIAFKIVGSELVIRQNEWSTTTGKHLNQINTDKSIRVSGDDFKARWNRLDPSKVSLVS
jgi:hypothetical protein